MGGYSYSTCASSACVASSSSESSWATSNSLTAILKSATFSSSSRFLFVSLSTMLSKACPASTCSCSSFSSICRWVGGWVGGWVSESLCGWVGGWVGERYIPLSWSSTPAAPVPVAPRPLLRRRLALALVVAGGARPSRLLLPVVWVGGGWVGGWVGGWRMGRCGWVGGWVGGWVDSVPTSCSRFKAARSLLFCSARACRSPLSPLTGGGVASACSSSSRAVSSSNSTSSTLSSSSSLSINSCSLSRLSNSTYGVGWVGGLGGWVGWLGGWVGGWVVDAPCHSKKPPAPPIQRFYVPPCWLPPSPLPVPPTSLFPPPERGQPWPVWSGWVGGWVVSSLPARVS